MTNFEFFFVFFFFYTLTTTKQSCLFYPFFLFFFRGVGIRKAWLEAFVFTSWPRFHGKNKMPCPVLFLYFFVLFIGATMNQHPPAYHSLVGEPM
jgi:hypothetical protein